MKVVFAGNCQAYALYYLYERHIGAPSGQEVGWVDAWNEHRLDDWKAELSDADVVVMQVFTGRTRVPVAELSPDVRRVSFPDVRGNFLWPYGNVSRIDNPQRPFKGGGPYDTEVGDAYLNRLIEAGVSAEDALRRYLDLDVAKATHLDRVFELMIEQQRDRDQATGFEMAGVIEDRFREERLFHTQGHLSLGLFRRLATQVYERIGAAGGLIDDFVAKTRTHPFEPYHEAPIHPNVASHYGLKYIDDRTQYHHVQEGRFDFSDRVIRYMNNDWSPELHEGHALADAGDWPRALALLERGLEHASGSAHGYDRKSDVLRHLGRLKDAVAAAETAVRLEPGDEQFASRLAHLRGLQAQDGPP